LTTHADPVIPGRFEIERAAERAAMPTIAKDVIYALCRRMDAGTPVIPLRHMPSLTTLAAATGWSRRHIERALNYLEAVDVVDRARPSVADARAKHARTAYTVHHDPLVKLGTGSPQESRDAWSLALRPGSPQAKDTASPDLGTGRRVARDTVAHVQTFPDHQTEPDPKTALVIRVLKDRTGRTVSAEWAAKTAALILARPAAAGQRPEAYIRRILMLDRQIERWLPTPAPPAYQKQESSQ
jgi:hypothetical protein